MQPHIEPWREQGIEVVFTTARSVEDIESFIEERDVTMQVLLDPEFELHVSYAVRGIPAVFVIDTDGVIRHTKTGWGSGSLEELQGWIADLIDD